MSLPDPAGPKVGDRFRWWSHWGGFTVRYVDDDIAAYVYDDGTPGVCTRKEFASSTPIAPPLITEPTTLRARHNGNLVSVGQFRPFPTDLGTITLHPGEAPEGVKPAGYYTEAPK